MLFSKKAHEELPPERPDSDAEVRVVKSQPPSLPKTRPEGAPTRSVIDPWLRITGNLEGEAELQIDGEIIGDIHCTKLVVSKGATVTGNVTAEEVTIRGTVIGVIRGNRVVLQEGAFVQNEISYKQLSIEEGAHFEGIVRMSQNPLDELRKVAAEMKAAPRKLAARAEEARRAIGDEAVGSDEEYDLDMDGPAKPETFAGTNPAVPASLPDSEVKRLRAQLRSNRPT